MENILITIFLYIATFYVLCDFAKTKSTTTSTIDTTTNQVLDVVTDQDDIPTATTDHTGDIEPIAIIETTKPATGHIINSQTLACIFEDRDIPPVPTKNFRKQSKKKNISGFIREINVLTQT